jgi:hypothetical protein
MVAATPVAVERAFAERGVLVSRVPSSPDLCNAGMCFGLDVAGGGGVVYLAPLKGKDFMVVLFRAGTNARRAAALENANPVVRVVTKGPALLVYMASSSRISRLRAALAATR